MATEGPAAATVLVIGARTSAAGFGIVIFCLRRVVSMEIESGEKKNVQEIHTLRKSGRWSGISKGYIIY